MLSLIFALLYWSTTHQIDFALQPLRPTRYNHKLYTNQRKDAKQKYITYGYEPKKKSKYMYKQVVLDVT